MKRFICILLSIIYLQNIVYAEQINYSGLLKSASKINTKDTDKKETKEKISMLSSTSVLKDFVKKSFTNITVTTSKNNIIKETEKDTRSATQYVYKYRRDMSDIYKQANDDVAAICNRYLNKAENIPLHNPYWLIAIMSIEYNAASNDSDLFFSFPVNTEDLYKNRKYLLEYNWNTVYNSFGKSAVLRRTGGAIGLYQCESYYGGNSKGIIPKDLGVIGTTDGTNRKDCSLSLKDNGSNFIWVSSDIADRWSICDATNIVVDVYNKALSKNNALTYKDNNYSKATYLMWAHNRGQNILKDINYSYKVDKIVERIDELIELVYKNKPAKFSRQSYLMDKINEIAEYAQCDTYPVMALTSYIIIEARYNGRW